MNLSSNSRCCIMSKNTGGIVMKKMFSIIMICLLLFVSMKVSIATEKNDGSNFKESIIIKSNDEQIKC